MSLSLNDLEYEFYKSYANKNLLTANQSSFETDTTGWTDSSNATLARSTAHFKEGIASLSMTAIAAANMSANTTPAINLKVIPGQIYTANAFVKAAATPRSTTIALTWRDSTNATISTVTSSKVADNSVGWKNISLVAQAPSNADHVFIVVTVYGCAAGEVHYVDAVGLFETPNMNLISNPDFENDIGSYSNYGSTGTPTRSTEQAYTGTASIKYTTSSANSGSVHSSFPTVIGNTYTVSAYVKRTVGTGGTFSIHVWSASPSALLAGPASTAMDGTWQRVSTTFTATTTSVHIYFAERSGASVTWHMDAVQVVKDSSALPYLPPSTTNLIANPSAEVDLAGYADYYNATLSTATQAFIGLKSLSVASIATGSYGFVVGSITHIPISGDATVTASMYVRAATVSRPFRIRLQAFDASGADIGFSDSATVTTSVSAWTRVVVTYKVPSTTARVELRNEWLDASIAAGEVHYIDGVQLEYGSVATPFVDGSLGAGYSWNSSENLLTAQQSSFETATDVGGWIGGGGITLTNDATQFYSGVRSLLVTCDAPTTDYLAYSPPDVTKAAPSTTYTASFYVRASAVREARIGLSFKNAAGAETETTATAQTVANGWIRLSVTATSPTDAVSTYIILRSNDKVAGDTFHIDAVQIEQRPFATPYGQTGVAHASTSTRKSPWVLGQTYLDPSVESKSFNDLERAYWVSKSKLTPEASYSLADHQRAALIREHNKTVTPSVYDPVADANSPELYSNGDLLMSRFLRLSGLSGQGHTGIDHEIAFYRRILGE